MGEKNLPDTRRANDGREVGDDELRPTRTAERTEANEDRLLEKRRIILNRGIEACAPSQTVSGKASSSEVEDPLLILQFPFGESS